MKADISKAIYVDLKIRTGQVALLPLSSPLPPSLSSALLSRCLPTDLYAPLSSQATSSSRPSPLARVIPVSCIQYQNDSIH